MAAYPSSVASFIGFVASHTLLADQHASQHNLEQGEIVAVQTKVGTGSSTATSGTLLRGTGAGTSAWAQAVLTSDVTGVLPVANGGTGQSNLTNLPLTTPVISNPTISGGGSWAGSPTITTPTVASFTNAQHNHQNAAGGGLLNGASAITDGTLSFAELTTTIFSSQVLTQVNAGSGGGTIYYVNLGGIKMAWGSIDSHISGNWDVTLPTSFFSTIQTALVSPTGGYNNTNQMTANIGAVSAVTLTLTSIIVAGASPSNPMAWFLIGT